MHLESLFSVTILHAVGIRNSIFAILRALFLHNPRNSSDSTPDSVAAIAILLESASNSATS